MTCQHGDIFVAFDNDQVIGKSWRVKLDNKVHKSVITTLLYVVCDPATTVQSNPNLSPATWLNWTSFGIDTLESLFAFEMKYISLFEGIRSFMQGRIDAMKAKLGDIVPNADTSETINHFQRLTRLITSINLLTLTIPISIYQQMFLVVSQFLLTQIRMKM